MRPDFGKVAAEIVPHIKAWSGTLDRCIVLDRLLANYDKDERNGGPQVGMIEAIPTKTARAWIIR